MSGQETIALLPADGGCPQFWAQCHQPLIGAPSPGQANQPWYPTVIFPTTSPGGLAALATLVIAAINSVVDTAARADPAATEVTNLRRETAMCAPFIAGW